jgi:hypothetical protein
MFSRSVFVHCPSRLSAAAAVLTVKVSGGDGVFALWTGERGQAMHHFDGVMSHIFKCSPSSRYGSEPKSRPLQLGFAPIVDTAVKSVQGRQVTKNFHFVAPLTQKSTSVSQQLLGTPSAHRKAHGLPITSQGLHSS